jgi:hypothetical protein
LEKIGQRGNLAYPPHWAAGLPLMCMSHQMDDLLKDGCAALADEQKNIWGQGDPPKSKIFVISKYEGSLGKYRELEKFQYAKLNFEEKRHLGVLPNWGLTDKEMLKLGLLEKNQVVLSPSASAESSQLGRGKSGKPSPGSSSSVRSAHGELRRVDVGPNFQGWTAERIRNVWLPKIPRESDVNKRDDGDRTPLGESLNDPAVKELDQRRRDRGRQGR